MNKFNLIDRSVVALYDFSLKLLPSNSGFARAEADLGSLPIQNIDFGAIPALLSEGRKYRNENWIPSLSQNNPMSGNINFINDVSIAFDMDKIIIRQQFNPENDDSVKPDIVRFSRKLIDSIKKITPKAMGLNYTIFLAHDNPDKFLKNLINNANIIDNVESANFHLVCDYVNDDELLNLYISKSLLKEKNRGYFYYGKLSSRWRQLKEKAMP